MIRSTEQLSYQKKSKIMDGHYFFSAKYALVALPKINIQPFKWSACGQKSTHPLSLWAGDLA